MGRKKNIETEGGMVIPWYQNLINLITDESRIFRRYVYVEEWKQWFDRINDGPDGTPYPWMKEIKWKDVRRMLRENWEDLMPGITYNEGQVREVQAIMVDEMTIPVSELNLNNYVFLNGIWITEEHRFIKLEDYSMDGTIQATWGFPFEFKTGDPTPAWDKWRNDNQQTYPDFENMFRCILNRDFESQYNFWLEGPSFSGKSTVTFALLHWLDPVVEYVDLDSLTDKFGDAGLQRALILYEDDLEPGVMSKYLTKALKKNANVNHKKRKRQIYESAAKTDDAYFHITAVNQFARMTSAESVRAPIYRRAYITQFFLQYDGQALVNDAMQEEAKTVICELLEMPYHRGMIKVGRYLKEWTKKMKTIWVKSSMPAYWWVATNCQFDYGNTLNADDLVEKIDEFYRDKDIEIPESATLMSDISLGIQFLKGRTRHYTQDGRRRTEYTNVSIKSDNAPRDKPSAGFSMRNDDLEKKIITVLANPAVVLTREYCISLFRDHWTKSEINKALENLELDRQIVLFGNRFKIIPETERRANS